MVSPSTLIGRCSLAQYVHYGFHDRGAFDSGLIYLEELGIWSEHKKCARICGKNKKL